MFSVKRIFREAAKKFVFRHTRLGAPHYSYNVEPIQLATLVMEADRLRTLRGAVLEIGVARGMTTRFLAQHFISQGLKQCPTYFAMDTFESFKSSDLEYEVNARGKSLSELEGFEYNDFDSWSRNFSGFPFVKAIKADCASYDYTTIAPIKLTFLDVDLYLPTKRALPKIYESTVSGGVILVDDVRRDTNYDGACQAYEEFCLEMGMSSKIIGNKCGVIYKP